MYGSYGSIFDSFFGDDTRPPEERRRAQAAIYKQDLFSELPASRERAARFLGANGIKDAVPALVGLLHDTKTEVQAAAIVSLGKLGGAGVVPAILNLLEDSKSKRVHYFALYALGDLAATEAIPSIRVSLSDDRADVRQAAATALGKLGNASSLPQLKPMVENDRDDKVRKAAAEAVFRIGSRTSAVSEARRPHGSAAKPKPFAHDPSPPLGAVLHLSVSTLHGLRVGHHDVFRFRVSNTGMGPAIGLTLSVLEDHWRAKTVSASTLAPGASQAGSLRIIPKNQGPEVPVTFRLAYADPAGVPQEIVHRDSLLVSGNEEEKAPVHATNVFVQQQQTGEGPMIGRQSPGPRPQPDVSATPQLVTQCCDHCGEMLDMPRTPRFCPNCGERLQEG